MNQRAFIVVGWKDENPEVIYCGTDGVAAEDASNKATESKDFQSITRLGPQITGRPMHTSSQGWVASGPVAEGAPEPPTEPFIHKVASQMPNEPNEKMANRLSRFGIKDETPAKRLARLAAEQDNPQNPSETPDQRLARLNRDWPQVPGETQAQRTARLKALPVK